MHDKSKDPGNRGEFSENSSEIGHDSSIIGVDLPETGLELNTASLKTIETDSELRNGLKVSLSMGESRTGEASIIDNMKEIEIEVELCHQSSDIEDSDLNDSYEKHSSYIDSKSEATLPSRGWKKLLYLQQPYPDNYTDISFLSQLKRNTTVTKYSYGKLVEDFSLIIFHLSSLFMVILVFAGIYLYQWKIIHAVAFSSILTIVGLIAKEKSNLKSYLIFIFMLLILSPVLKSLTRSTSSDSIWALSCLLFLANTVLHDYAMNGRQYRPILSTNISLSNAIVLASRLNTNSQVFLFVLFAIQINILFPLFNFNLRLARHYIIHYGMFLTIFLIDCVLFYTLLGFKVMLFWGACSIAIMFVLPVYYLFLQKYKNELQGPWDIAKPILNKA